jgi:NADPH:quinone reductase-like Zn-dependent oxidoreductase
MLVSMFVRQQASPTVKTQNHDDLVALKELVEAGKVTPVIDGTFPLHETRKAIERVASGRARGTIVIDVIGQPHPAVAAGGTASEAPIALPIPV